MVVLRPAVTEKLINSREDGKAAESRRKGHFLRPHLNNGPDRRHWKRKMTEIKHLDGIDEEVRVGLFRDTVKVQRSHK